jgi:glycosyltransferase involved in cell wall biosynthesis
LKAASTTRRVAILYHYLAHYREAVFATLSGPAARHDYEIFSDRRSNISSLATIAPEKSRHCDPGGQLNWRFVRNRWITRNVLWQSAALRIALSPRFDTVILLGNMQFISTWLAAALARIAGKRVLMWTHGLLRPETGLRGRLRKAFYRLAHGLLLYGNRARELLAAQGFDANELYVVYNSLDTAAQLRALDDLDERAAARARTAFDIPLEAPLLVAIGRLVPGKDLDLLLPALSMLKARGLEAHLLLIGDGPVRSALELQASALKVDRMIHFAGPVYSEQELCPLIAAADLCVSPGPVGLTAMHALIYGTPVITHDDFDRQKPEFEVIQPGITGDFFRRGDPADLARTIEAWLFANKDRRSVANRCRERLLSCYTAENQREIIDNAVDGIPARSAVSRVTVAAQAGEARDAAAALR